MTQTGFTRFPASSDVRLTLNPAPHRRAAADGVWRPRSRDATAELPGLIAAVDRLLGRVVLRAALHRDAWDHIPRRVPAAGREVRVGWFRHADPDVITLTCAAAEPIVLLVIPPGTDRVALRTTRPGAGIRAITGLPAPAARTNDADGSTRWENEGGA